MTPRPLPNLRTAVLAPLAIGWIASATNAQVSDREARESIAFARGLAAEWGFVDMAEDVIRDVEREGTSEKLKDELSLLKCSVYFEAAKNDPNRRLELAKASLDCHEDFLARNPYSEFKAEAEAGLVGVANYYSKALAMQLEDAVGEEAASLRQDLQNTLTTALSRTNDLVNAYASIPKDERSDQDDRTYFKLLLDRGNMYLELAKSQDDGIFNFEQSFKSFEDLVDESGEGSPWSLRAFAGIGDNLIAQGEPGDAAAYYEFVCEMAVTRDKEAWAEARKDMSPAEIEQRFFFVQLGIGGTVSSYLAAGQPDEAIAWGLYFHNLWKQEGLSLTNPIGPLGLLEVARALVESGGWIGGSISSGTAEWYETEEEAKAEHPRSRDRRQAIDLALTIALGVNRDNKGNTLQLRAQKVISEIISRPGVVVAPEVLFEAAQGEYYDGDFMSAVESLKRVLASLEQSDEAKRIELGPEVLWTLGRCYEKLERPFVAAAVFEEAYDHWKGDPRFDSENAKRFYALMNRLKKEAKGDPLIEALWRKSENAAATAGSGAVAGTIAYRKADVAYSEASESKDPADYAEAQRLFLAVPQEAEDYEKAQVFAGVCLYKQKKFDEATDVFSNYVDVFLEDALNTTTDPGKLAARLEAKATAVFYWGLTGLAQKDWDLAIEKLDGYDEQFPEQKSYAPAALYRAAIAHSQKNQPGEIGRLVGTLTEKFPDSQWTGAAATLEYKVWKDRYEKAQSEEEKTAALRKMAENLQLVNRTSNSPSYVNLRNESMHWMELGEYETAEGALRKIDEAFKGDESYGEKLRKNVYPDLGEALAKQYKVDEAVAFLDGLVEENLATRRTARFWGISLVGWVELDDGSIRQVPGAAKTDEEFEKGTAKLNQLADSSEKWDAEWYQYKFDTIYGYHQWGQLDGKKLESAKKQLEFLVRNLDAQFTHENMPEDLQQKFVWLYRELR